jgi:hypothetical protein
LADGQEELRRRCRLRFFVVSARAWDLLLRAKHLFVAAIDGWGSPGFAPTTLRRSASFASGGHRAGVGSKLKHYDGGPQLIAERLDARGVAVR